ncbi:MAG: DNA replication/repair protein RecF [Clostridia bacterium]|nr:DNA replication/repair protein RecF [Clostridia bacterium]
MFIKSLEVNNFRNYVNQKIEFSRETNIIYGKNAQGKTNLLEAVSLFSSGKSFRRAQDRNLIKDGEPSSKINIEFEINGVGKDAEIIINRESKKYIKLCGAPLHKTSELLGQFKSVIFSPEEMSLITGAPELRRNFTDLVISSEKPVYYNILKRYYKILKQKNNLLKQNNSSKEETLAVWNESLAQAGAKIMVYRKSFIDLINPYVKETFEEITEGKEDIKINYVPSVSAEEFEENTLYDLLLNSMNKKMQAEIMLGASVCGIHRDDYSFFINGKNAKSFSSQGQQRTAIIALKMAQAEIIKENCGEYPVFLLDDVMSELDFERRNYLSEKIKDKQVIITCTDKYESAGAKCFYVENGTVSEE